MTEPQDGLFGPLTSLDSRGAMAMVDALNGAFTHSKVRGGNHVSMFLRFLHSKGWELRPCDPVPLIDEPDATD